MLSSHVYPSFSHCYPPLPAGEEEEDKQGGRRKKGRRQGGTQGRGQEAAPPEQGRRQEGTEGKKVEATVVPQPLDGDGNPIDTEACTVTFIEEPPQGRANAANAIDVGILHVKYRILCRILNTMKNTVFFCVFCAVPRGILDWYSEGLRILCECSENTNATRYSDGIL